MTQERKDWQNSEERWAARKRYRRNLENILARGKISEKRRAARVLSPGATTPSRPPEPALEDDVSPDISRDDLESLSDGPFATENILPGGQLDEDGLIDLPIAK